MQSGKDEKIRCNEAVHLLKQIQLTLTSFPFLSFVGKAFKYGYIGYIYILYRLIEISVLIIERIAV